MLRQLAVSIATLIALSHSQLARAEAWFEVEVYVFERQSQTTEQWPDAPIATNTHSAIDFISPLVAQVVTPVGSAATPCTLVFDADANSHCAEQLNADGTTVDSFSSDGTSAPAAINTAATEYRYPSSIPSEIGNNNTANASSGGDALLLPSSRGKFASIISSLSRERGNRSLLHMTWQQPMRSKSSAVPIRLFAGKDFSGTYHFDGRKIAAQALNEPMLNADGTPMPIPTVSPVWELDGTLNIYLNHYLYIETALNLRKEGRKLMAVENTDLTTAATPQPKVMTPYLMAIPLEQNRRVKSEEIHYLDHPEMGMVIQIRKMAQPSNPVGQDAGVAQTVQY
ncbi:peptidoglycan binding protein CsiV [Shewanella putrefaciens]|uniref:peptidoglycan binding protein CsiV n=1 Tax=Shewanella putrefaciens TaxID=24 RepID=UPI0018E7C974|nr:peptidoglycan binding protein CsiV [Shewanella putrefaciens]